jgi:hypothetical protein
MSKRTSPSRACLFNTILLLAVGFPSAFCFPAAAETVPSVAFVRSDLSIGNTPFAVAVGDFNGDRLPDLVTANYNSNNVSVLLGKGDGTFQTPVTYATGVGPSAVITGDFDDDGRPDLAVTNNGSTGAAGLSILLGNGDGTFQSQLTFATAQNPYALAAGDFNNDGKLDLAVADLGASAVSLLLGNGDGTFQPAVAYGVGVAPVSICVGDFNSDGSLDLAVANEGYAGGYAISVLLGNGDGTFQPQVLYITGASPDAVAAGDFNGDGRLDLAVGVGYPDSVSIFLGNGDGTFQAHVDYPTGSGPASIVVDDLNGDGKPDLAVADYDGGTPFPGFVSVLLGNGDGTFQPRVDYAIGSAPNSIVAADLNQDGRPDLAVADSYPTTISLLLQTTAAVSPSSLAFGLQAIGTTSQPQTATLTNLGPVNITIGAITITGTDASDFAQTNTCGSSLGAGASCTISVTFAPLVKAFLIAALSIADSAVGSPQQVALTGQGVRPTVILAPTTLNFGDQQVGTTSQPQTATLANTSQVTVVISKIRLTGANPGDFIETNTCGPTLPVRGKCAITVKFAPTAKGARHASVTITDNAVGGLQILRLKGNGM